MREINSAEPRVTDHALVRYIERVHGVNMDKLKENILTDAARLAIKCGARRVKAQDYSLVIVGNAVVTVLAKDM